MRWCVVALILVLAACGPKRAGPPVQDGGTTVVDAGTQPPTPPDHVLGVTRLTDENPNQRIVEVHLTAQMTDVDLGNGKLTHMYTYNGQFPGPLLELNQGDRVIVHFKNELPEPTTIHWHGLRIQDYMDGSPRLQDPVPPGGEFTYDFVPPDAGSFWYHPHLHANEQLEKGLYGPIIVHRKDDPVYSAERYLILDDILLGSSGQIAAFNLSGMEGMHGRYGNHLLTNGHLDGVGMEDVQHVGAVERWRLVNTANARTMSLSIDGAQFQVIGTDGGLLPKPYLVDRLIISPGQRFDVEVYYDQPGQAVLNSWIESQDSSGNITEDPYAVFTVDVGTPEVAAPKIVRPVVELPNSDPNRTITYELDAVNDPQMGLEWRINGQAMPMDPLFTFQQGDTVLIHFKNDLGMEHPFHIHGQFFQLVDNGATWSQPGLKDTLLIPGNTTVDVIAYMNNPGRWMAHCHILEHAELGMMSEFIVEPKP